MLNEYEINIIINAIKGDEYEDTRARLLRYNEKRKCTVCALDVMNGDEFFYNKGFLLLAREINTILPIVSFYTLLEEKILEDSKDSDWFKLPEYEIERGLEEINRRKRLIKKLELLYSCAYDGLSIEKTIDKLAEKFEDVV